MDDGDARSTGARQVWLVVIAAIVGVLLGWAGARPLSGVAVGNLLIWGFATVALGLVEGSARAKAIRLAVFGFALGLAFMCFGYSGQNALATRLVPFAVIGVFCALCAVGVGALTHVVRSRVRSRS